MRVSLLPVSVPVYLASLSPRMLELTGEIADGSARHELRS